MRFIRLFIASLVAILVAACPVTACVEYCDYVFPATCGYTDVQNHINSCDGSIGYGFWILEDSALNGRCVWTWYPDDCGDYASGCEDRYKQQTIKRCHHYDTLEAQEAGCTNGNHHPVEDCASWEGLMDCGKRYDYGYDTCNQSVEAFIDPNPVLTPPEVDNDPTSSCDNHILTYDLNGFCKCSGWGCDAATECAGCYSKFELYTGKYLGMFGPGTWFDGYCWNDCASTQLPFPACNAGGTPRIWWDLDVPGPPDDRNECQCSDLYAWPYEYQVTYLDGVEDTEVEQMADCAACD